MKYYISETHVKKEKRKSFFIALFFVIATIGCTASLLGAQELSNMFLPIVGIVIFTQATFNLYRKTRDGRNSYPVIELDESTGEISVTHKDMTIKVDIKQAKNLRIQYKSKKLQSAVIKTASGEEMRFEGYENIDELVSKLERFIPDEKTTTANIFHK